MTLTLAPETEIRLRTVAEGRGLEPAELHEDLLQQALAEAEAELSETLAGLDESVEAMAAGRWITLEALDERLSDYAKGVRDSRTKSGQS
ncbi:MAG: hypothetical protein ACRYFS_08365 [Janthinobacterium lividum]